jgi:hypothetical protein
MPRSTAPAKGPSCTTQETVGQQALTGQNPRDWTTKRTSFIDLLPTFSATRRTQPSSNPGTSFHGALQCQSLARTHSYHQGSDQRIEGLQMDIHHHPIHCTNIHRDVACGRVYQEQPQKKRQTTVLTLVPSTRSAAAAVPATMLTRIHSVSTRRKCPSHLGTNVDSHQTLDSSFFFASHNHPPWLRHNPSNHTNVVHLTRREEMACTSNSITCSWSTRHNWEYPAPGPRNISTTTNLLYQPTNLLYRPTHIRDPANRTPISM